MADSQMQATIEHSLFELRRGTDVHLQVHLVAALNKALGGLLERARGVGNRGIDDAQVQGAADLALEHIGVHA
ncbi:hypothetical protein D3C85_1712500 [compost metagenome]